MLKIESANKGLIESLVEGGSEKLGHRSKMECLTRFPPMGPGLEILLLALQIPTGVATSVLAELLVQRFNYPTSRKDEHLYIFPERDSRAGVDVRIPITEEGVGLIIQAIESAKSQHAEEG
ncbi:hypothetical protein ACN6K4_006764 [Streptomyces hayashii]|uniref:hypothetical protein n=1 Tax=Streptomyces hayashii TaxID=2839966 RepID=UPI00403C5200